MKNYLKIFIWSVAIFCVTGTILIAGTNNLPTEVSGVIQLQHINKFKTALSGDLVPRDSSGNVGDITASLGSQTNRFTRTWIKQLSIQKDQPGNPINFLASTMGSAYTLTFPASLPSAEVPLLVGSSGTIAYGRVSINSGLSSSSGAFSTTSSTYVDVTNLSVTITSTGRPIQIQLIGSGGATDNSRIFTSTTADSAVPYALINILRDSTQIFQTTVGNPKSPNTFTSGNDNSFFPPGVLHHVDTPAAGTYVYKIQTKIVNSNTSVGFDYCKLYVYEMP